MRSIFSPFIRLGAFAHKEMIEIFRQPRLLFTLIIGPFLILLLFGIGYRNEGRTLRAIIVASKQNPAYETIQRYAKNLGKQLSVVGMMDNLDEAKEKLHQGQADIVVVVPDSAAGGLQNNRQSVITILHNEIDPYQADYVEFTGKLYIENLNRWILGTALEKKKSEAGAVQKDLQDSIQSVRAVRTALAAGQIASARASQAKLNQSMTRVTDKIESVIRNDSSMNSAEAAEIRKRKDSLSQDATALSQIQEGEQDYSNESRAAEEIERDLLYIQGRLSSFRQIDSRVLIQPFVSNTRSVAPSHPQLSQYFIPSVIVLLLQHLAITLAGLSIVREFRTGAAELFRVSPLRCLELLIGKYIGYFIVGALVAFFLTAALLLGLKMPMLGDWRFFSLLMATFLFTSLALGFTFSLLATTETQAIQYTMIFLLVSIFFSGFLLNLQLLWPPIRVISWLLPATYGIRLAQQIMLRGETPDFFLLALLFTLGVYFFVISYRLLRKRFAVP
jgi:ABC-2 type transport system permease protein